MGRWSLVGLEGFLRRMEGMIKVYYIKFYLWRGGLNNSKDDEKFVKNYSFNYLKVNSVCQIVRMYIQMKWDFFIQVNSVFFRSYKLIKKF